MEINGTFDAQRFYQTLANIIGNREGVEITAIVHEKPPPGREAGKDGGRVKEPEKGNARKAGN